MELSNQTSRVNRECFAARNQCAWFDHPNRCVIEVTGSDRSLFLHNVLSNDIKSLAPGQGKAACLLTAQAQLIASMNVLCFEHCFWLATDYSLKEKLLNALAQLIIMEHVTLTDRSGELKLISLHGPKAKALLERMLGGKLPKELLDHQTLDWEGARIELIRINLIGETGYGFLISLDQSAHLKKALNQKGVSFDLTALEASSLEVLRIEAGIPRYGIDFDESIIPLEARLEHAVSFSKGCFPGQEILARLDSRGGVAKKLSGLELKGEVLPKKNDRITQNGKEVGSITSSAFSPILKRTIALGYLKKECWVPGSPVVVESKAVQIPARTAPLPFYQAFR